MDEKLVMRFNYLAGLRCSGLYGGLWWHYNVKTFGLGSFPLVMESGIAPVLLVSYPSCNTTSARHWRAMLFKVLSCHCWFWICGWHVYALRSHLSVSTPKEKWQEPLPSLLPNRPVNHDHSRIHPLNLKGRQYHLFQFVSHRTGAILHLQVCLPASESVEMRSVYCNKPFSLSFTEISLYKTNQLNAPCVALRSRGMLSRNCRANFVNKLVVPMDGKQEWCVVECGLKPNVRLRMDQTTVLTLKIQNPLIKV